MQNGFQFCPTVVLCFIIIKNVTNILPAGSIFFPPLFQSYSKSVTAYFTVHVSRDRQGGGGQSLFNQLVLWVCFTERFCMGGSHRGMRRWEPTTCNDLICTGPFRIANIYKNKSKWIIRKQHSSFQIHILMILKGSNPNSFEVHESLSIDIRNRQIKDNFYLMLWIQTVVTMVQKWWESLFFLK